MTYKDLRAEVQSKHDVLFTECGVFWAFSMEQFKEQAPKGVKLVSIGMGGYLPKENYQKLVDGLAEIKKYKRDMRKQIKAEDAILYELNNYECFYTGDIEDAMPVLAELGYSYEQVRAVYRQHYERETVGM
jgi:hypothetical protein